MALQFVSGWLVDRFDVSRVLAAGYLIWSLATAATGIVQGFAMLLAVRLMLGTGESVVFPACSKILARHSPEHNRGVANGVLMAAMVCGPAAGTFGAGLLMAKYGWRPVFIGIGLLSLAWLPAWMKWMPRGEAPARSLAVAPGFLDILRQRSFWGACAGHFCGAYPWYFLLMWLPFYLMHERHLSMPAMAKTLAVYYLVDAASALATGWLTDLWIRRGFTTTVVRKSAMALGWTTAAVGLAGCALAGSRFLLGLAHDHSRRVRNGQVGYVCVCPDACRAAGGREVDRFAKRVWKPGRRGSAGTDRIPSRLERKLSGRARDNRRCLPAVGNELGVLGGSGEAGGLGPAGRN